ncbi:cytoskeletal protein RodZ [compost metagenome]
MSDLGHLLRKARMDKKISLDDLEDATKIRKRYLQAIEDGDYKLLPGSFYVRAFIKSYAEAVGLDPTEVLKLYQSLTPEPAPEKPAGETNIRSKRAGSTKNTDKLSRLASNVVMISFVVLILAVAYYYFDKNYKGTPADENPTESQPPRITNSKDPTASANVEGSNPSSDGKPTALPSPTPSPIIAKTEVTFTSSDKGVDNYLVKGSEKLNIQLKITGAQCWIQVDALSADNKKTMQKQKLYKNGELETFELDSSAYLNIGAASAVELTVNGVVVTVGDTANVKRVQLNLQKS